MTLNIQKTQFQKFPYWSFLTCQDHGGRGRNQGSDWYPAELDQGYDDPWKGLLTRPWRCLPSGNIIFVQGIVFFNIVALEKQVFPFCPNSITTWLLIINIQLNGWPGSPTTMRKTPQQWPWRGNVFKTGGCTWLRRTIHLWTYDNFGHLGPTLKRFDDLDTILQLLAKSVQNWTILERKINFWPKHWQIKKTSDAMC